MLKRTMNESIHTLPALTKQIDSISEEIVSDILTSPHKGEGVFGFEVAFDGEEKESTFFSPPFFRTNIGMPYERYYGHLRNDVEHLNCYQIALTNPSFLPLFTDEPFALFEQLGRLSVAGRPMFFQILFQKKPETYREIFVEQYIDFLKGNNNPVVSKLGRRFQNKLLNVLNRISGFDTAREESKEIEYKIMDTLYRFEIRLFVHGNVPEEWEQEVQRTLDDITYYNEMRLFKVKRAKIKQEVIEDFINQTFSKETKDQVLSETELMMLSMGQAEEKKQEVRTLAETIQTAKQEVIKIPHFQSLLKLLPSPKQKEKRELDARFEKDIPKALKKTKVMKGDKIKIVDVALGAVMQRITFEMPEDTVFTDFEKKCKDVSVILGEHALSVIPGDQPNTVTFLIPCKQREVVYLRSVLENPDFIEFAKNNPLPFVCGRSVFDDFVFKCLTKAPHIMICGGTNSGKSVFLNSMLITFILLKKPDEIRFYMIDPKFVELSHYEGMAHVEDVILDMDKAVSTLTSIANLADARYKEFSNYKGVRNIEQYNEVAKTKMPYVVFVVEEYYDLKMYDKNIDDPIKRLTQKGRAAGVHMILATQRPDKEVMEGVIKANIPSKICFKLGTSNDYKTVYGTGIPYRNLLGFGDGVVQYVGQTEEFIRFQAPAITLDRQENEDLTEKLQQAFKGEDVVGLDMEVPEEPEVAVEEAPIDKVKRYIADTGETRTEQIRNAVGGRINLISDILKQLTAEGWLAKEGRKRIVTASEEELNKWRSDPVEVEETEDEQP